MEHDADPMESEEQVPLMNRSSSSGHCSDEISEEEQQQSLRQNKHSDLRAPAIILGFECLESVAYFGISTNLVVYLGSILHGSKASNAANVTTWTGTCYFTPVIGAAIADTVLGNYKMIVISLVIYLVGTVMITSSALSPYSSGSLAPNEARNLAFFSGLYLVAIGSGGVKSALLPLGADQFGDESIKERERKSLFFSLFYLCLNVGVLCSSTLIVWIQVNVAWALGFGITTLCIALSLGGFLLGTPTYRLRAPSGSPLKSVLQVLVAAFRKTRMEAPPGSMLLYEVDDKMAQNLGCERLAHTNEFRFLDKAAMISDMDVKENLCSSWSVCTVTRVEELKILIRLLPIWMAGVIYSAAYAQMSTTFVQQGAAMNTTIGSFSVPPASLASFEVLSVVACVAASNRLVLPLARRCLKSEMGLSLLQRIGVGQSLMVLAMATAAAVEFRRLDGSGRAGESLSIAWQLPQYFLVACSEVFCFISQHEFFYSQAPETMKSMCTSFSLLAISVGSYLSSLIVTLVARFGPGGLSEGRMDYHFLMFTGLCALNCACYFVNARRYTPKQVTVGSAVDI